MMFLQVIILLAGFLFLVKGADWFVEGAASIAKKLGIPQLIIGLTIVAMGTSMPEAAVSITAAINKNAARNVTLLASISNTDKTLHRPNMIIKTFFIDTFDLSTKPPSTGCAILVRILAIASTIPIKEELMPIDPRYTAA